MIIACANCGSEKFKAGELLPSPEGGVDVVMPCAECGTPQYVMHEDDPVVAKSLIEFFKDPV